MIDHIEGVLTDQRGQGLIEYILIVALIAVGSILVLKLLGPVIANKFQDVLDALKDAKPGGGGGGEGGGF